MSRVIDSKLQMSHGVSRFPFTPDVSDSDIPYLRSPTPTGQGSTSTDNNRILAVKALSEDRSRFGNDPGCFITGFTCLSLEAVHIVKPVRDEHDRQQLSNVLHLLTEVLAVIRHPVGFTLQSLENMFLLYPPYQKHLDLYATYAITLCKESLQGVIQILKEANQYWDNAIKTFPERVRFIPWNHSVLLNPKFDIILLHPNLFLPRGQPLVALENREKPSYTLWMVIDRELRQVNSAADSAPYPPFSHTSRNDSVNPLLLILNAGLKLQHHNKKCGFSALTDRQGELAQLTLEAYELVYYCPEGFIPASPPTVVSILPPRAGASFQMNDTSSLTVLPNDRAGSDRRVIDDVDELDEERSEDEWQSDDDVLNIGESDEIMVRFADPNTTLQERMDLGALLLGGAQPCHPFPQVPDVELTEEPSLFGRGGQESEL